MILTRVTIVLCSISLDLLPRVHGPAVILTRVTIVLCSISVDLLPRVHGPCDNDSCNNCVTIVLCSICPVCMDRDDNLFYLRRLAAPCVWTAPCV